MRKRIIILALATGLVTGLVSGGCGKGGEELREERATAGEAEKTGTAGLRAGAAGTEEGALSSHGSGASPAEVFRERGGGTSRAMEPVTGGTTSASGGNGEESGYELAPPDSIVEAVQDGPSGRISLQLPADWDYELLPPNVDASEDSGYGIRFSPPGTEEGYVQVMYGVFFGVCGTGLVQEEITIAGKSARMGIYDGHEYWDFIFFGEQLEGIVALTYFAENWWDEYGDQVTEILDTLSFDGTGMPEET